MAECFLPQLLPVARSFATGILVEGNCFSMTNSPKPQCGEGDAACRVIITPLVQCFIEGNGESHPQGSAPNLFKEGQL